MHMDIGNAKQLQGKYLSLFNAETEEKLSDVAPYIFAYHPNSDFANWFMEVGWGQGWGIMVRSGSSIEELHAHCRKFLVKENETGQEMYFRYYDPRVLSIFLPTCSAEQLKEFFGPIDYIMIEDIDPNYAQLIWLENYQLYMKAIGKEELLKRFRANEKYAGEQFDSGKVDKELPIQIIPTNKSQVPRNELKNRIKVEQSNPENAHTEKITSYFPDKGTSEKWLKFFFD
jgi:Domain of unknown function (DUF4123)